MTTLQDALTPPVLRFCAEEQLGAPLARALDLIQQHFPDVQGLRADPVWDPDVPGDVWVSLTVTLSGSLPQVLSRDDRFLDDWVATMPWPASDKIVVDLDVV